MKLIIPMAGRGTRVRPHSHVTPKPLLPVKGKSMVERIVDTFNRVLPKKLDEGVFVLGPRLRPGGPRPAYRDLRAARHEGPLRRPGKGRGHRPRRLLRGRAPRRRGDLRLRRHPLRHGTPGRAGVRRRRRVGEARRGPLPLWRGRAGRGQDRRARREAAGADLDRSPHRHLLREGLRRAPQGDPASHRPRRPRRRRRVPAHRRLRTEC